MDIRPLRHTALVIAVGSFLPHAYGSEAIEEILIVGIRDNRFWETSVVESWLMCFAAISSFVGMSWLALARETHWRQVCPSARQPLRTLQLAGSVALLLSLGLCFQADYPSIAVLVWVMLAGGSALVVALLLSWRSPWLRMLAITRPRRED